MSLFKKYRKSEPVKDKTIDDVTPKKLLTKKEPSNHQERNHIPSSFESHLSRRSLIQYIYEMTATKAPAIAIGQVIVLSLQVSSEDGQSRGGRRESSQG